MIHTCARCRNLFKPRRADALYCSGACRAAASRRRTARHAAPPDTQPADPPRPAGSTRAELPRPEPPPPRSPHPHAPPAQRHADPAPPPPPPEAAPRPPAEPPPLTQAAVLATLRRELAPTVATLRDLQKQIDAITARLDHLDRLAARPAPPPPDLSALTAQVSDLQGQCEELEATVRLMLSLDDDADP